MKKYGKICVLVDGSAGTVPELLLKAEKALRGGAGMLLLRRENQKDGEWELLLDGLEKLAGRYESPLFLEGVPDAAAVPEAAGIHLELEELESIPEPEPAFGKRKLRGCPVRNREEAARAEAAGADYLSAGPVSAEEKKTSPGNPAEITPEELEEICRAVRIPVFAESSFRADEVPVLSGKGIAGVLASALLSADGITEAAARLSDAVHDLLGTGTYKAAVFDYDGTILDSMPMWATVPSRFAARLGAEVEDGFNEKIKYMSLEESAKIFRGLGAEGSDEEIVDQIMEMVSESYRDELQMKDGVAEVLEDLKTHGVRMCVATQTPSRMIRMANKRLGIDHYFDEVYSCGEWETHKTEPDIYYIAAAGAGAAPCETLVFEDIVYAVETAKRAGFTVMGVADDSSARDRERIRKTCRLFLESYKDWPGIVNLEREPLRTGK